MKTVQQRVVSAILDGSMQKLYEEFLKEKVLEKIYGQNVDFEYFQNTLLSYNVKQAINEALSQVETELLSIQRRHGSL